MPVTSILLTFVEGTISLKQHRNRKQVSNELSALALAAQHAGAILRAQGVELLGLQDNRLDSLYRLDLIKQFEERIARHQPQVVYVHHAGDVNVDHHRLPTYSGSACPTATQLRSVQ